jgi:hypothetical protein
MRVVRNTGYVKGRQRAGRMMVGLGLMLVVGFWLVNLFGSSSLFPVAMAAIVIGFVLFYGGLLQLSRWSRRPGNDQVLDIALARLNDRYTLIHYADFPGKRAEHVLITPGKLLVMTTREMTGRVRAHGRSWRRPNAFLFGFMRLAGPQLGNPTLDTEQQIASLRGFMDDEQLPGEIEGAIVFVDPRVDLEIDDPELPVLRPEELFEFVREVSEPVALGSRERERLAEQLARGQFLERSATTPSAPRPKKKRVRAA